MELQQERQQERQRLMMLLIRQDFPDKVVEWEKINIHQQRGYQAQVSLFLKRAKLFGYVREAG